MLHYMRLKLKLFPCIWSALVNKFFYVIFSSMVCLVLFFLITTNIQASSLLQQETPYYPPEQTGQAPTESYPYPPNGSLSPTPSGEISPTPSRTVITSTPVASLRTPTPLIETPQTQPTFVNRYATEMAELALSRILPNVTEEFPSRTPWIPSSPKANAEASDPAREKAFNLSRFGLGVSISLILVLGFFLVFRLLQSGEFRSER